MKILIAILIFLLNFSTPPAAPQSGAKLILAGIDSLTMRSCCNGVGYVTYLTTLMKNEYGDGGIGYVDFDYTRGVEYTNYTYIKSSQVQDISLITAGTYPTQFTLDLKGAYSNSLDQSLSIDFHKTWSVGKIYYLVQPDGGSFNIGNQTINTVGDYSLGEYVLPTTTVTSVSITQINNKVVIFGGLFLNNAGVAVTRLGKGGDPLKWHSSIDSSFRDQWVDKLKPSQLLLNSGTNDYLQYNSSPVEYQKTLIDYISPYTLRGIKVTLIHPNLMQDSLLNAAQDGYEIKQKELVSNYVQYVSNRTLLGATYNDAVLNGLMDDIYHPNQDGSIRIANSVFNYIKTHP